MNVHTKHMHTRMRTQNARTHAQKNTLKTHARTRAFIHEGTHARVRACAQNYTDRLREAQAKTGLQDGVRTGTGLLHGIPVALGVMEFGFMGGSMGSVVGEKLTRLIEYATQVRYSSAACAQGGWVPWAWTLSACPPEGAHVSVRACVCVC